MNAKEYQSICKRPDAFQRGIIDATDRALKEKPHLALKLREVLNGTIVPKPDLHDGSKESDYFLIRLNLDEAEQIQDYLFEAEAGAVGLNGETTPTASHFASLVDTWQRYVDFCGTKINF